MPDEQPLVFRISPTGVAWNLFPAAATLLLVFLIGQVLPSLRVSPGLVLGIAVGPAFVNIWLRRAVYVSPDGICGPSRRLMRWAEITQVDNLLARSPFGYLSVQSTFVPRVLIPSLTARDSRFRAAVLAHAPAGNPLIVWLGQ